MNRREFCQTASLFLAGSMVASASLRSEERKPSFRAQKVFLDSWNSENALKNSLHTTSFVRNKLELLRREGCNGLILIPGDRTISGGIEKIQSEAVHFGLKIFVPARFTCDFFSKIQKSIPLACELGTLQNINGTSAENGGFLLLDGDDDVLGLVLYDSSRCSWAVFKPLAVNCVQASEHDANAFRLQAARWLDNALLVHDH